MVKYSRKWWLKERGIIIPELLVQPTRKLLIDNKSLCPIYEDEDAVMLAVQKQKQKFVETKIIKKKKTDIGNELSKKNTYIRYLMKKYPKAKVLPKNLKTKTEIKKMKLKLPEKIAGRLFYCGYGTEWSVTEVYDVGDALNVANSK